MCNRCHKGIPRNQGYYQSVWAGKLITECYTCKPAPVQGPCGRKDADYRPCVLLYGHIPDCSR